MDPLSQIRKKFNPIQPITLLKQDGVRFQQFAPHPALSNYIYYYWEFRTTQLLAGSFDYRVVPNGCIDMYFEVRQPSNNYITGLSTRNSAIELQTQFHYVGVCFMPLGFSMAYKVNAAELTNRYEKLGDVLPQASEFIANNFSMADSIHQLKEKLDSYFLRCFLKKEGSLDSRLVEAMAHIMDKNGQLHIEKDIDFGLSPRQLRRLFQDNIGLSPKSFASVIRFQKAIQTHFSQAQFRAKVNWQDSFYDHPHFIREFKKYHGGTPGKIYLNY